MFNAQGLSRLFLHLVMFCLVAATACFAEVGQYTVKEGKADVLRGGKLPAVQIVTGLGAETGDVVRTKRGATVLLELDDRDGSSGSVITINENTRFAISRYVAKQERQKIASNSSRAVVSVSGSAKFHIKGGIASSNMADNCIKNDNCRFSVVTRNAVAGVRGTVFNVAYIDRGNITIVGVESGQVDVANAANLDAYKRLNKGELATVKNENEPIVQKRPEPVQPQPYEVPGNRPQSIIVPALPPVATPTPAPVPAPALAVGFTTTPSVLTGANAANFVFAANDAGATLEYQLDGGAWTASPAGNPSFAGLTEGAHTLNIRATNAGGTVVTNAYTWTTDYTAPTSAIAGSPAAITSAVNGTYNYSTSDLHPGIAQYRVNGGAWSAFNAANPLTLALAEGVTTVDFQAIDAVGNASGIVSYQLFKGLNGYFLDTNSQGNNANMNSAAVSVGNLNAVTGYTNAGYRQTATGNYVGATGLPTKVTLYGNVRTNPGGVQTGYFISYATLAGTPAAFNGTTTFKAFADNYLFTGTGSLTGTTSGGTFNLIDQQLGGVTVTPLQYNGALNYVGGKGTVVGQVAGTGSMYGTDVPLQFLGLHNFTTQNPALVLPVFNTLSDGGNSTFLGRLTGVAGEQAAGDNEKSFTGGFYGIWAKNDLSAAGLMVSPNITGTAYGQNGVIDATGIMNSVQVSGPIGGIAWMNTSGSGAVTAVSGDMIGPIGNTVTITRLGAELWGIGTAELAGTYSTAIAASNISNHVGTGGTFNTDTDIHVTGTNAAKRTFTSNVYGYTTPTVAAIPEVSLTIGRGDGSFDPGATTWQLAFGGVNLEASKFNALYNDAAVGGGREKLGKMGVPVAEVGFVPSLTNGPAPGNINGITSISMNNVTFLAPATGQKPVIWSALGGISGTYDGTGAAVVGNGYLLTGNSTAGQPFSIQFWGTTFTPGSKWIANLTNGTGTVMLPGATPITWRGSAAGATIGGGTFSGQAVGVAR